VALVVIGVAMAGGGAYLVSTAKPMWGFNPISNPGSLSPRIEQFRCVDYNPYAGTGSPEVRCTSNAKVTGYILLGAGAGLSALGLLGR